MSRKKTHTKVHKFEINIKNAKDMQMNQSIKLNLKWQMVVKKARPFSMSNILWNVFKMTSFDLTLERYKIFRIFKSFTSTNIKALANRFFFCKNSVKNYLQIGTQPHKFNISEKIPHYLRKNVFFVKKWHKLF